MSDPLPCTPERRPQPSHCPGTSLRQGAGPTCGAQGVGGRGCEEGAQAAREPRHPALGPQAQGPLEGGQVRGGPSLPLPSPRAALCWSPPGSPGLWVVRAHGAQLRGWARGSHGGTGSGTSSRGPPGLGCAPGRPPAASHSHEVGGRGRPRVGPWLCGPVCAKGPHLRPGEKGRALEPSLRGTPLYLGCRWVEGSAGEADCGSNAGHTREGLTLRSTWRTPLSALGIRRQVGASLPVPGWTREPRGRAKEAVTAPAHGSSGRPPLRPSRCRSPGEGAPAQPQENPTCNPRFRTARPSGQSSLFSDRHRFEATAFPGAVNGFSLSPHQLTACRQILN